MENKEEQMIAEYIGNTDFEETEFEEIPIPMNFDGILDEDENSLIQYDLEKFKKGIKDYSYISGAFTALRNAGMSETNIMSLLLGEMEIKSVTKQLECQERITKIKAEASLKEEV